MINWEYFMLRRIKQQYNIILFVYFYYCFGYGLEFGSSPLNGRASQLKTVNFHESSGGIMYEIVCKYHNSRFFFSFQGPVHFIVLLHHSNLSNAISFQLLYFAIIICYATKTTLGIFSVFYGVFFLSFLYIDHTNFLNA